MIIYKPIVSMDLLINHGLVDLRTKKPPLLEGRYQQQRTPNLFINFKVMMEAEKTGKNVSIYFSEDELDLLEQFQEFRKSNYLSFSGWVKQNIHKTLTQENKKLLAFR